MNLSSLSGVGIDTVNYTPKLSSEINNFSTSSVQENTGAFETLFQSAVQMVNEANDYSNAAEEEEVKYAMGETDSIHDLQIAQQKANISLQYTVAVRDAFISAYREIMNLQF